MGPPAQQTFWVRVVGPNQHETSARWGSDSRGDVWGLVGEFHIAASEPDSFLFVYLLGRGWDVLLLLFVCFFVCCAVLLLSYSRACCCC